MPMFFEAGAIIIAYLLGSIPAAYIIARLRKGVDIREVGVGNMGGANVIREIGIWEGVIVLIADMGKGAAAVIIAQALGLSQFWVLGAGFAAILGHSFPVYIGFRGGQGVATVIGIFSVLAPLATLITLLPLGAVLFISRNIFASVLVMGPLLPLVMWLVEGSTTLTLYALGIVGLLVFRSRHRLREARAVVPKEKQRGLR
jgi:glycerol-3-phosphate acyltransferase PlsY